MWAACTQQRDALSYLRRRMGRRGAGIDVRLESDMPICRRPGWYVDRTFDEVHSADSVGDISPALELFVIPKVAAAALVHAPIGAFAGFPVPLGWASFDPSVVARTETFLRDRLWRFVKDEEARRRLGAALIGDEVEARV